MAAPEIEQILKGIETRLKTIPGFRTAFLPPPKINPPCGFLEPGEIDYRLAMRRGSMSLELNLVVLVSIGWEPRGLADLMAFASPTGPRSIVATLEGDPTLGGLVAQCWAKTFTPLGLTEYGQIEYYAGQFALGVTARGK